MPPPGAVGPPIYPCCDLSSTNLFFLHFADPWKERASSTLLAKTGKKYSPTVLHLRSSFIPSLEKEPPRMHNFVCLRVLDVSFQEVKGYKHNFVSVLGFLM
jgi:hypothetical protein